MENFIKALFISLLTSGSFMTHAADNEFTKRDAAIAASYGLTLQEYRDGQEAERRRLREQQVPRQHDESARARTAQEQQLVREMQVREENEYQRLQTLRSEQTARRLEAEEQARHASEMARAGQIQPVYEDARQRVNGDAEIAQRLQREEQEAQRKAEAALQQMRMQHEEQRRLEEVHRRPEPIETATFITQVNALSELYASGAKRPILEHYMRIFNDLSRVAQHADVHILDRYVFGTENNIRFLVDAGQLFQIDNPALKLKEVGQQMIKFVNEHQDIFGKYKYIANPVTSASIISSLTAHFTNMDAEVGMCPAAREIWSRAWTLALKLYEMKQNPQYIQIIFDQAIEGHLTRGGCIQGRINRGFVAYVILLGKAGVGLPETK